MENLNNPIINQEKINVLILKNNFFRNLFFLTLNCKRLITTTPNLNIDNTFFRKSLINKKISYEYVHHTLVSMTTIYNSKAFINFNYIHVATKYHIDDIEILNKFHKRKIKYIKTTYGFFDNFKNEKINNAVLIAPTWGTNFTNNIDIEKIFKINSENGLNTYLKPHPREKEEFYKKFIFLKKNSNFFFYDDDPKKINSFFTVVSDWSGITIEYSLLSLRKSIVFNTNKKILNLDFKNLAYEPFEFKYRKNLSYEILLNDYKSYEQCLKNIDINKDKNNIEINQLKNKLFI